MSNTQIFMGEQWATAKAIGTTRDNGIMIGDEVAFRVQGTRVEVYNYRHNMVVYISLNSAKRVLRSYRTATGKLIPATNLGTKGEIIVQSVTEGKLTPRQQKQVSYLQSLQGNDIYARNTEHQMTCKCGSSCIYQTVEGAIEFVQRHAGHATWHSIIHK
jgi:hypothetical protein